MGFEHETMEYAIQKKDLMYQNDRISDGVFREHGVYRGLRDINGKGVLTGLTNISDVTSFRVENGRRVPADAGVSAL